MAIEQIIEKLNQDKDDAIRKLNKEWDSKINLEKAKIDKELNQFYSEKVKDIEKSVEENQRKRVLESKLEQRNSVLHKKRELIEKVFSDVFADLLKMDEKEYFSILVGLVTKYSESKNEELLLNSKDKERYGKKLLEVLKGNFTLGKDTVNISGGVILKQGKIEINASFDILLKNKRDVLEHQVGKVINVI